jgi:hypothetical protein
MWIAKTPVFAMLFEPFLHSALFLPHSENQPPCNPAVKLGPFSPLLFALLERCAFGKVF